MSQDALARTARIKGFAWTRSTLAKIERGERALSVGEFVRLEELVPLSPSHLAAELAEVAQSARNRALDLEMRAIAPQLAPEVRRQALAGTGEAEAKAAVSLRKSGLDVAPIEVSLLAFETFGRSLTDERDARLAAAGEHSGSISARRGWVTREVVDELRPAFERAQEGWQNATEVKT